MVLPAERGRVNQLSRSMERVLGSKIEWMRIPSVKSVMKALEKRILASILEEAGAAEPSLPAAGTETVMVGEAGTDAALAGEAGTKTAEVEGTATETVVVEEAGTQAAEVFPAERAVTGSVPAEAAVAAEVAAAAEGEQPVFPAAGIVEVSPPLSRLCRRLIEKLGPQGAVEVLIVKNYGELLDPARYGPVTELEEAPKHEKRGNVRYEGIRHGSFGGRRSSPGFSSRHDHAGAPEGRYHDEGGGPVSRVYVGLGRRHGASARDVAELLVRAGGVPGRLVDSIEMKDYCAFATLPAEAARRACAFSRKQPKDPAIKPALAVRQNERD
jgi:ATP-dependent RNA helicase DeaD